MKHFKVKFKLILHYNKNSNVNFVGSLKEENEKIVNLYCEIYVECLFTTLTIVSHSLM